MMNAVAKVVEKASNNDAPVDLRDLWVHFSDTYVSLRWLLTGLAFFLPLVLLGYGYVIHDIPLQHSMSAYFFAATADQCAVFPMRTPFVGFLCAVALGLFAYRGFTGLENTLLNLAALCAIGVAVFPENIDPTGASETEFVRQLLQSCPAIKEWATSQQGSTPWHYGFAVLLFVLLAIVAWKCADKTLNYLPSQKSRDRFRKGYKLIAGGMIAFPFFGLMLGKAAQGNYTVFFIEWLGVWTFAIYWAVKSHEMRRSRIEASPGIAKIGMARAATGETDLNLLKRTSTTSEDVELAGPIPVRYLVEPQNALVRVTFTCTTEGNIEGLAVGIDGEDLVFDKHNRAYRELPAGEHDLSWDAFGTHPAGFKIEHTAATPASTILQFKEGQEREDGVRTIVVAAP
jgi:hypothetical protein